MSKNTLASRYDHKQFEEKIYRLWDKGGYFSPHGAREAQQQQWSEQAKNAMPCQPFVIAIPPPNVTGILHMGHGLNISVQDICIRYRRMCGHETLWIPGCDHAGIATQHVVERILREQGKSREKIGRDAFLQEANRISKIHHGKITEQIQRMGASCDWTREAFTLDEERSKAVQEVFVRLYEKGYIYRGEYLVNWCTQCHTALSDDEVTYLSEKGGLYKIRYPFANDENSGLEVVTTRPETMLGDEAVAVHPDDPRYQAYIGRKVILPLVNRELPVIGDTYIDHTFGSGVLKVTPAHDVNDFEIAQRHNLPITNILTAKGHLNQNVPEQFRALSVTEARREVAKALEKDGYLTHYEAYTHQVGHCYRCNHIIEPFLSTQWFVKMKPLAAEALNAWKQGDVRLFPARWGATYTHWLENIRDWCISRQLWWGHRIPVWYNNTTGEMIVSRENPLDNPKYQGCDLVQDSDVLDTWFSSWLWPFSILNWSTHRDTDTHSEDDKSNDYARYYPTSTLITGYDIIFFWVARMIMAGREFTGKVPFRDVILTGLIRDKQGRKMSKSVGNGIDPLEIIESHGADALKFSLTYLMAHGQDIRLAKQDFAVGSRFANKIWNAARFILSYSNTRQLVPPSKLTYNTADYWIYNSLQDTITRVETQMSTYRFSDAVHSIYDFFWNDFCDWYIESAKIYLENALETDQEQRADNSYSHLLYIFETTLRLLHPFMSFLTEELYQHIRPLFGTQPHYTDAIIIATYPTVDGVRSHYRNTHHSSTIDAPITSQFEKLQAAVTAMRTIRSEFALSPSIDCNATIVPADQSIREYFESQLVLLQHLSRMQITVTPPSSAGGSASAGVAIALPECEITVHILDKVDIIAQRNALKTQQAKIQQHLQSLEKRLKPDSPFCQNANPEVIANDQERMNILRKKDKMLTRFINDLQ